MDDAMGTPPVRGEAETVNAGPGDLLAQAVGPAIKRGVGAVLAVPPNPVLCAGALRAAIERASGPEPGLVLIVSSDSLLPAWSELTSLGSAFEGLTIAPTTGRALRLLDGSRALVVPSPVAASLLARSALPLDRIQVVVVAWPEQVGDHERLATLLHELPKSCPRVILTSDPIGQAAFIERHAFKVPVAGPLARPTEPIARLRVATAPWEGRLGALDAFIDSHDPVSLTVWTASPAMAAAVRSRGLARGLELAVVDADRLPPGPALALDPPPPAVLAALATSQGTVLMPPGTEDYFTRMARHLQPVGLPGWAEAESEAIARERDLVRARLDAGGLRGSALTLGPLLERYPASQVAAALHALWRETPTAAPPPTRATAAPTAKVWVSVGRKDGASVGELMAFLIETLGIDRGHLGRVELRETFTLIECTGAEAEPLAERLAGQTFRSRRLSARVDRGRGGPDRSQGERRPPRRRAP